MSLKPFIIKHEEITPTANPHLQVVNSTIQTPTGEEAVWSYIKTKEVVYMFALDEDNNVFLKGEWRLNIKSVLWELPAGFIEEENPTEEQILAAANRELQEEIGMKAGSLEKLTVVSPSSYLTMKSHIFLATNLSESKLPEDEHEYLEVKKLPVLEAYKFINTDQIPNSQTLIAFEIMLRKLNLG